METIETFDTYQRLCNQTKIYPTIGHPIIYPTLGLVGETGEFADKIKKVFRDKNEKIESETLAALKGELGDCLWYITQLCTELDLSLSEVVTGNIEKLFSRQERMALHGDGDNR